MASKKEILYKKNKDDKINKLSSWKIELDTLKSEIELDKDDFANKKIKEIDDILPNLPDRKASTGNQTMKEYLHKLRYDIEKDKIKFSDKCIADLEEESNKFKESMDKIDGN